MQKTLMQNISWMEFDQYNLNKFAYSRISWNSTNRLPGNRKSHNLAKWRKCRAVFGDLSISDLVLSLSHKLGIVVEFGRSNDPCHFHCNWSLLLPNTPSLMIERGKHDEVRSKLRRIRGVDNIDQEFNDLIATSEASKLVKHPWKRLFERKYRPYLSIVLISFFQQLTGINAIMFYGPVLFNASLMSSVITGIVNVGATLVSIYDVDKWGMRFLFLVGGV